MLSCSAQKGQGISDKGKVEDTISLSSASIQTGADNSIAYLPLLKDKKVGIVTNQTGGIHKKGKMIIIDGGEADEADVHISIVDFLLNQKINLQKIFAPEHGFRGTADAGEHVVDGKDSKTGLLIVQVLVFCYRHIMK